MNRRFWSFWIFQGNSSFDQNSTLRLNLVGFLKFCMLADCWILMESSYFGQFGANGCQKSIFLKFLKTCSLNYFEVLPESNIKVWVEMTGLDFLRKFLLCWNWEKQVIFGPKVYTSLNLCFRFLCIVLKRD